MQKRAAVLFVLFLSNGFLFADGPGPSEVTVNGHQLIVRKRLVDGTLAPPSPWVIRGVVWSPASTTTNTCPACPDNADVRRPEFGNWDQTDVPLLAAMDVNTVRMLIDPGPDAAGRAVLDLLHAHGIMVVMTVDDGVNNLTRIQQVVPYFKDHPTILMWSLGSEWNINRYFGAAATVEEAAQRTQTAAALVKSLDPTHPVATSYGDIDIDAPGMRLADTANYVNDVCTSVDAWGLNVYRGNSMGTLYTQWAGLTTKPMFLGEYGTDAFRSAGSTTAGSVDGVMQSDWNLALWDELFGHFSANVPEAVALGGFVFEFNDEWWKVSPSDQQGTGGFAGAHPDGFFNEEYFGVFDIARNPRPVRDTLGVAFDAGYEPPGTHSYRVISRGAAAEEYPSQYGTLWFFRDGAKLYSRTGGSGGGRGFHVAVFDPASGGLQQPVAHFDPWATRSSGDAFCAMNTFLDGIPNGMLLLMGVVDEAGLTQFPPSDCQPLNNACRTGFIQRVTALGSQKIGQYCYRGSWAMAAVKGEGVARQEEVSPNAEVAARTTLPAPVRTLSVVLTGNGTVRSVPAGVNCSASCDADFRLGTNATLYPVAATGWLFEGWSGDCAGTAACDLAMTADRNATAAFAEIPGRKLYLVTPCRVLDTRGSNGPYGGPALAAASSRTVALAGRCGIPASAKAVVLNGTAVTPAADGSIILYPADAALPSTNSISYRTGRTRANNAVMPVSSAADLAVYNTGPAAVHFLIDVTGYFQ